jgi:glutathione S-transferase
LKLKLYTNSHSVTCSKIEVVIDFKSLEIEKIEAINNYGAFSPTSTVPCLSIDNNMISDSSSIIEYFEEAFSSPSLLTKDAGTNILIRFQATLVDEKLIGTIRKLFSFVKNTSHPSDSMMIDNIFKEIENNLNLVFQIKGSNLYLASSSMSLADCNTPAFFSMLKEFENHFNKQVEKSNSFIEYEKVLQSDQNLFKEYKRYGFEIRNWIANKLLA